MNCCTVTSRGYDSMAPPCSHSYKGRAAKLFPWGNASSNAGFPEMELLLACARYFLGIEGSRGFHGSRHRPHHAHLRSPVESPCRRQRRSARQGDGLRHHAIRSRGKGYASPDRVRADSFARTRRQSRSGEGGVYWAVDETSARLFDSRHPTLTAPRPEREFMNQKHGGSLPWRASRSHVGYRTRNEKCRNKMRKSAAVLDRQAGGTACISLGQSATLREFDG